MHALTTPPIPFTLNVQPGNAVGIPLSLFSLFSTLVLKMSIVSLQAGSPFSKQSSIRTPSWCQNPAVN